MELTDRIINALHGALHVEYYRLDDEDGVSGFVVSPRFENVSSQDRQRLIDKAIQDAADPFSDEEQRQIIMIAGITPLEYDSVGARIRVHGIKELANGSIEVTLHGMDSDATYVRGTLDKQGGVTTTDPQHSEGAEFLMTFQAKGTGENPLTKEKAISVLAADQYIEVMQNA